MAAFRVEYSGASFLFTCILLLMAASPADPRSRDRQVLALSAAHEIQLPAGIEAKPSYALDLRGLNNALRKKPNVYFSLSAPAYPAILAAAPWWTPSRILATLFFSISLVLALHCLFLRRQGRRQAVTIRAQLVEAANLKRFAETANRAKGEFLEKVIQEIRAPMAGVIGTTQLALDTSLSVEQREYLLMVNSSADALLTVVNNILDFSRMEAGELEIEKIPFTLTDTLVAALRSICMNAHEKGLELVYEIDPEVPARLLGDPGRLRQVLLTLVGNAIRFTNQGEVGLHVVLEERTNQSIILRFSVNEGDPADTTHRQQAISTGDDLTASHSGGTGLGLSFCKQLIGLMGGRFWLESDPGNGKTFHFTGEFWGYEPAEDGKDPAADVIPRADCQVLIVDDNATSRRILEGLLSRLHIRHRSTHSGTAALQILTEQPFQVVLLDMQMPEVDGFEVATQIRQRWSSQELKIILLTSMGVRGDARQCRELNIDAYLVKPIAGFELAQAINQVFASKAGEETGGPPKLITRHSLKEQTSAELSPQSLNVLVAEDNKVNQALARGLLEKQGHRVTIATNGQEAMQACERTVFDLILMDVQMPVMDGFEATRAIRLMEGKLRRTPIIALTGHTRSSDEERCLAAGMDAFLSKPIHLRELSNALSEFQK